MSSHPSAQHASSHHVPSILQSAYFRPEVVHPMVSHALSADLFPSNELAQLMGTQDSVFDLEPPSHLANLPSMLPEGVQAVEEAIRALGLQLALPSPGSSSQAASDETILKESTTRLQLAGCFILLRDVVRAESELQLVRNNLKPGRPGNGAQREELGIRALRMLQLTAEMMGKEQDANRFVKWIQDGLQRLRDRAAEGSNGHASQAGHGAKGAHALKSEVPDVPGDMVDEMRAESLKRKVASLCGLNNLRFPGAQPVSFTKQSLDLLKKEDFWVCEKSDGQRVLVFIALNKTHLRQEVFLIDRKNHYREQHHVFFPHHEKPGPDSVTYGPFRVRYDTLLDGELVWDVDKQGRRTLRLLLFDCIVMDGDSMASRPLSKRYGRLRSLLWPPYHAYLKQHPHEASMVPFDLQIKPMELCYGLKPVLKEKIPNLEHGNDGLIFTCINSGYTTGTDPKIIKWKPPSENTVDFKLRLRFPPDLVKDPQGRLPDLSAKPFFQLDQNRGRNGGGGDDGYDFFDWLYVEDDEWENMKASGVQFDDRIVECFWHPFGGPLASDAEAQQMDVDGELDDEAKEERDRALRPPAWKLHRIRDDKTDGNHSSIVVKILQSIMDGVEEDELLAADDAIRTAWKSAERTEYRKKMEGPGAHGAQANVQHPTLAGMAGGGASSASVGGVLGGGGGSSGLPQRSGQPGTGVGAGASGHGAPPPPPPPPGTEMGENGHSSLQHPTKRGPPPPMRGRPPSWLVRR